MSFSGRSFHRRGAITEKPRFKSMSKIVQLMENRDRIQVNVLLLMYFKEDTVVRLASQSKPLHSCRRCHHIYDVHQLKLIYFLLKWIVEAIKHQVLYVILLIYTAE